MLRKLLKWGGLTFLGLMVFSLFLPDPEPGTEPAPAEAETPTPTSSPPGPSAPATTPAPPPAPVAAAPAWDTVASWSGTGSKDTETFEVAASEWRIRWKAVPTSTVANLLDVRAYRDGARASVANASASDLKAAAEDVSYVRGQPGRYHLSVGGAGLNWTVYAEVPRRP